MTDTTPHTDEKPYSPFPVDGIPSKRVHCLSILNQLNNDADALSPEQRVAFRSLYRLDDNRKIQELIEVGELEP